MVFHLPQMTDYRSLLYTDVTRARKTAIVLGDRWGIRNCAKKCQVDDGSGTPW